MAFPATVGEIEVRSEPDASVTILRADPVALISWKLMAMLTAERNAASMVAFADGCVILAGQVHYRPTGFTDDGHTLVCELVSDDRPEPGAPEPSDPNVPFETGRTLDPDKHPHPLRAEDVQALIAKEIS